MRLGDRELGAEAVVVSRARERQAVAAGVGEMGAGVTVLALPTSADRPGRGSSTSNRGASPFVKAPRSEAVVDSSSGNTRVCASVMRAHHRGASDGPSLNPDFARVA